MATQDILPTGFRMQQLLQNKTAYEEMLTWKSEGPQDSFLALVDVNAVSIYCAYNFSMCQAAHNPSSASFVFSCPVGPQCACSLPVHRLSARRFLAPDWRCSDRFCSKHSQARDNGSPRVLCFCIS